MSRLLASMVLLHGSNVTLRLQLVVPPAFVQFPPFNRACTTLNPLAGEPGSLAVPETVIVEVVRLAPFAGLEIVIVGGVISMLTVNVTGLEVETFPAGSTARAVQTCAPLPAPVNDQS